MATPLLSCTDIPEPRASLLELTFPCLHKKPRVLVADQGVRILCHEPYPLLDKATCAGRNRVARVCGDPPEIVQRPFSNCLPVEMSRPACNSRPVFIGEFGASVQLGECKVV